MSDTVMVLIRLRCFARQEGSLWVSSCPTLDVYSQGDDREQARQALHEAVELWLESCLERGTLGEALRELGWHKVPPGARGPEGEDQIQVLARTEDEQVLGEPFSLDLKIPAYQAALFDQHGAPC